MRRRDFLAAAAALPALHAAEIPRPAPLRSFPGTSGARVDLAAFKGKVVAVEFLLTYCSHCHDCSRILQKIYNDTSTRGFQPVGIATNAASQEMANMLIPEYTKTMGLTWPIGWCKEDEYRQFLQMSVMERPTFPRLVIIDRKGLIRAQHVGGDELLTLNNLPLAEKNLRGRIDALLKEGPPSSAKK